MVVTGGYPNFSSRLPAPLAKERNNLMSDTTKGLNQTDEEILAFDVSDEALENAAGKDKVGDFTLMACTGLAACPA